MKKNLVTVFLLGISMNLFASTISAGKLDTLVQSCSVHIIDGVENVFPVGDIIAQYKGDETQFNLLFAITSYLVKVEKDNGIDRESVREELKDLESELKEKLHRDISIDYRQSPSSSDYDYIYVSYFSSDVDPEQKRSSNIGRPGNFLSSKSVVSYEVSKSPVFNREEALVIETEFLNLLANRELVRVDGFHRFISRSLQAGVLSDNYRAGVNVDFTQSDNGERYVGFNLADTGERMMVLINDFPYLSFDATLANNYDSLGREITSKVYKDVTLYTAKSPSYKLINGKTGVALGEQFQPFPAEFVDKYVDCMKRGGVMVSVTNNLNRIVEGKESFIERIINKFKK